MRASTRLDDEGQIHVLEMLTLFWLFFMSAIFILRIEVPDPPSIAVDATLELSGEDALRMARAEASDNSSFDSQLHEYLSNRDLDQACDLILSGLEATIDGRCWLAMDGSASQVYGSSTSPIGRTETVHSMLQQDSHLWTISLDVWYRGGGI